MRTMKIDKAVSDLFGKALRALTDDVKCKKGDTEDEFTWDGARPSEVYTKMKDRTFLKTLKKKPRRRTVSVGAEDAT